MTGFAKADHNVTLGQSQFIGPTNSYTHTLPMYCCIDMLSWLVCFSAAGFADHVKSRPRQWGPWRVLDGRYGSDIYPYVSKASLKVLQVCLGLWLVVLGLIATPNNPIGRYNLPPASHPPTPTTSHLPTPLYVQSMILQWLWKSCSKSCSVN